MMNFLKKLFRKKAVNNFVITLPFKDMRFPDVYLKNILKIMGDAGDLDYLEIDGNFSLEFCDKNTTHILYHGYTDTAILFEPESNGWTVTRVYLDRITSDQDSNIAFKNMEFLFKIPNILFGMKPFTDEGVDYWYPEFAAVYKEREESIA